MAVEASRSNLLLQAPINVRDPLMRKRIPYRQFWRQQVQQDLKHTNDHVSSMEKHWHQNVPVFPPNSSVDTDSLSVMVHSDEELVSDCEGLDTALKPPVRANEPPIRANEPPTTVSEPQSRWSREAAKRANCVCKYRWSLWSRFSTSLMGASGRRTSTWSYLTTK